MITDIRLQDFRSYKDSAYDLGEGVNIIVGPNASGKTNLLESILVIGLGSSYRASTAEQIRFGRPWARLEAHTSSGDIRAAKLQLIADNRAIKSFEIDSKPYQRLPLAKTLPVVLFEPQHLLMLTGRPDLRREFMDDLLEQTTPGFGATRRAYKRALHQRNSLLKKSQDNDLQQLFAWNVRVSELGAQLVGPRVELTKKFNNQIAELYQQLSKSSDKLELHYSSSISTNNYASNLLKKLEASVQLDIARGFTAHGPHRDDMEVTLNKRKAQDTASRGEIRTILLSLKINELHLLEKLRGVKPILLLDDVFSELDGARRKALTGYLQDYQTFITTTDADLVVHNFAQKCHIISMQ